jgi:flagellar L-ring protein precursor FlgH
MKFMLNIGMSGRWLCLCILLAACVPVKTAAQIPKKLQKLLKKDQEPSPLDQYVQAAHRRASEVGVESPGSLFFAGAVLGDTAIDVRARYVDDVVTIVVNESASAVSTGATQTSRASTANSAVTSFAGALPAAGRLANLANTSSTVALNGSGTTSRTTTLTTTVTARVTDVLPNGYLVIEGHRTVLVNSENQVITIRGVVRPADLTVSNTVPSGNVAQMELKIDGKGVVNDAIRRPNFIYRLLLGLLPF